MSRVRSPLRFSSHAATLLSLLSSWKATRITAPPFPAKPYADSTGAMRSSGISRDRAGSVLITESVSRSPDLTWRRRTSIELRPGARVRIGQDCDAFVWSFEPDGTPIRGVGFSPEGLRARLMIQGNRNALEVPLGGLPDWDFAYAERIQRARPGVHADLTGPKLSLIGSHDLVRVIDPDFPFRVSGFDNRWLRCPAWPCRTRARSPSCPSELRGLARPNRTAPDDSAPWSRSVPGGRCPARHSLMEQVPFSAPRGGGSPGWITPPVPCLPENCLPAAIGLIPGHETIKETFRELES